jgi:hypothetical protein
MSDCSVGSGGRIEASVRRAALDWQIDLQQLRLVGDVLDGPQDVHDAFDLGIGA